MEFCHCLSNSSRMNKMFKAVLPQRLYPMTTEKTTKLYIFIIYMTKFNSQIWQKID